MLLLCFLLASLFVTLPAKNDPAVDKFQLQRIVISSPHSCDKPARIACDNIKEVQVMLKNMEYLCTGEVSCESQQKMNIFITGADSLMPSAPAPGWNIITHCNASEGSDFVGDILPNFSIANELLFSTGNYAVSYCGTFNFTFAYLHIYEEMQLSSGTTVEPCTDDSENYKGDFYSAVFGLTLLGAVLLVLILYIFLKMCCFSRIFSKNDVKNDGEHYEDISTMYERPNGNIQNGNIDVISNFYEIPRRRLYAAQQRPEIFSVETSPEIGSLTGLTSASEDAASPTIIENKMYLQSSRRGSISYEI